MGNVQQVSTNQRRMRRVILLTIGLLMSVFMAEISIAGQPDYMKANLVVGQAFEIKGKWDKKKEQFTATDIEELPNPRRPKLRGEIIAINKNLRSFTMYGVEIAITSKTQFVNNGDVDKSFAKLKVGQKIEVSCKVYENGAWRATKIRTRAVKGSNKIKGTITKTMVDGNPVDTIEISGLKIILIRQSDYIRPGSSQRWLGKELFGDMSYRDADIRSDGIRLNQSLFFSGEYRQNFRNQNEFDLSQTDSSDLSNTEQDIRLELSGYLSKELRGYSKLRFRKKYIVSQDGDQPSPKLQADFIELYVLARDIGGSGVSIQIGRQDFDEPREWLFDEYLDAVRVYYTGIEPVVLEAAYIDFINPIKDKFDSWTDLFGRVRYYLDKENSLGLYFLTRSDTDLRNREPVWYGLSYNGEFRLNGGLIEPWFDGAIMRGEDKGKTLKGRAIDLGLTGIATSIPLSPSLTFGYAYGSGDSTSSDDVNNAFRQTGYQDNVDRFGGETSVRYYGSVLAPELSNLKVYTFGFGVVPISDASIEFIYHSYRQNFPDDDLQGSDLVDPPARPNGVDDDLGWGFDLVTAFPEIKEHLRITWTLGYFEPGMAYDPRLENALLNKINLHVAF